MLAWFALHLAQVLFTLARDLFNFGLGSLHLAQVLFTLARTCLIIIIINHHITSHPRSRAAVFIQRDFAIKELTAHIA